MKKFSILMVIALICSIFSGCQNKSNADFKIVTSCYPVYIMTLNIVKDIPGVEVVNMAENHTGCLHNFQLQSKDLKKIEQSSVFVINGAGMETFLDKLLNEIPKLNIIDSSENIKTIQTKCHHHHNEENSEETLHEHCHYEENSHIWMSISNCIKQVENIKEGLSKYDSSNAEIYSKNATEYIEKLRNLKNDIDSKLKNLENKDIITFHEAFPYFANEFGLNILGVINNEPGEEPKMKDVKKIINIIKEKNVKSIFVEPQYSEKTAHIIANETGVKIETLDPAVTGETSLDAYINAQKNNLETLLKALS